MVRQCGIILNRVLIFGHKGSEFVREYIHTYIHILTFHALILKRAKCSYLLILKSALYSFFLILERAKCTVKTNCTWLFSELRSD